MTTIDWSAPLEAYHPDGRVVEVDLADKNPRSPDGDYRISEGDSTIGYWFKPDGRSEGDFSEFRIRNRKKPEAPALPTVEQVRLAENIVRRIVEDVSHIERPTRLSTRTVESIVHDARRFAALNPPEVDPLDAAQANANAVLKGQGTGTYDEALDALRDLMHALTITQAEGRGA